jgi:hypothetical protein
LSQVTGAPAADVDALRLLAMFLAHWDNKSTNQRIVCLDQATTAPTPGSRRCKEPLLMIQDLGSTFGPYKANLTQWLTLPGLGRCPNVHGVDGWIPVSRRDLSGLADFRSGPPTALRSAGGVL